MADLKREFKWSAISTADEHSAGAWPRKIKRTVREFAGLLAIAIVVLLFNTQLLGFNSIQSLIHQIRPSTHKPDAFHWGSCEGVEDKHFKCGYLDVPLDYTNEKDPRKVRLAVNLYQAGKSKSKNTIITNPGGPGGSGIASLYTRGPYVSKNLTMGDVDVLGFDPRGVNMSEPALSCFPDDSFRQRWSALTGQYYESAFGDPLSHLQLADSMAEATMKACHERWGDIPRFLSTASVARDVNAIREALGEEEIWGYMVSYGSGIGTHISQLFPDRIGRMMLDGLEFVKDHRELGGFGWTSLDNVTDAWTDGFLGECVNAGPNRCALAKIDKNDEPTTLESLAARMNALLQGILHRPMPAYTSQLGPGIVTYEYIIQLIYETLYNPYLWPGTASVLADLENGNTTSALEVINKLFMYSPMNETKSHSSDELGMLVICADAFDAPRQPIEWWLELQRNMTEKSFISGNARLFDVLPCRHFDWDVAEVYRGNFDETLKNPLLLIAEPYDPATPLRNGRRLAQTLGKDNARLVVHHGYGHSSRHRSSCTEAIKRAYFINGTLPESKETDCYADARPYAEEMKLMNHQEWLQQFHYNQLYL